MIRHLRSVGIERTVLVTGDRSEVAEAVARVVGIGLVQPIVIQVRRSCWFPSGARRMTIMVGDG